MIKSDLISVDLLKKLNFEYSRPYRAYHGVDHINQLLHLNELYTVLDDDKRAIEIAILFHDIVYVPGSKFNERLSFEAFDVAMGNGYITSGREINYDLVKKCILASENHFSTEHDTAHQAVQMFLDYDLWDFGTPYYEVFENNSKLLMNEYVDYHTRYKYYDTPEVKFGVSGKATTQIAFEKGRVDWLLNVEKHSKIFRIFTDRNRIAFENIERSIRESEY